MTIDVNLARIDVGDVEGVQPARQTDDRAAGRKSLDAQGQRILAEDRSDRIVVAHGTQGATERRAHQRFGKHQRGGQGQQDHRQQQDRIVHFRDEARERPGDARDAQGAAGQLRLVEEDEAHHLGKAEGHDRQIIIVETNGEQRDQGAEHGRGEDARGQATPGAAAAQRHDRRRVSADRIESDDAEVDETCYAPLDVEPECNDRGDGRKDEDGDEIRRHLRIATFPNSPCGRSSSRMTIMAKAMACL